MTEGIMRPDIGRQAAADYLRTVFRLELEPNEVEWFAAELSRNAELMAAACSGGRDLSAHRMADFDRMLLGERSPDE